MTSSNSILSELEKSYNTSNLKVSFLSNFIKDSEDSSIMSDNIKKKSKLLNIVTYCEKNLHFICKKCKKVPIIKFIDLEKVNYSCSCNNNKISLDEIYKQYLIEEEETIQCSFEPENYLKCLKHKQIFGYYCKSCPEKINICKECLREQYLHQCHDLMNFDLFFYDTDEKIVQIFKILLSDSEDNEFVQYDIFDKLILLLSVIVKDYFYYPNYSHFQIFNNFLDFIEKYIINKNNQDLKMKKEMKIISRRKFLEYKNNPKIIIEINITKNNFNDITDLCNLDLKELKKLILIENCIDNIGPLKYAKFKNIEIINLGVNKLNNNSIPCLFELNFPNLNELSLYSNNFTDCNIFNLKNKNKNLPNLEYLYFGGNKFNWNNNKNCNEKINIKYNFDTLKKIGLTSGVFCEGNITSKIESFYFKNLEVIYLSKNDINSLSFVEKLEIPNLKEIYIHTNLISEFYSLKKYKGLERIDIYENFINEISEIEKFIDNLPELIYFDISKNNIDFNKEENQKLLKKIKMERTDLIIII